MIPNKPALFPSSRAVIRAQIFQPSPVRNSVLLRENFQGPLEPLNLVEIIPHCADSQMLELNAELMVNVQESFPALHASSIHSLSSLSSLNYQGSEILPVSYDCDNPLDTFEPLCDCVATGHSLLSVGHSLQSVQRGVFHRQLQLQLQLQDGFQSFENVHRLVVSASNAHIVALQNRVVSAQAIPAPLEPELYYNQWSFSKPQTPKGFGYILDSGPPGGGGSGGEGGGNGEGEDENPFLSGVLYFLLFLCFLYVSRKIYSFLIRKIDKFCEDLLKFCRNLLQKSPTKGTRLYIMLLKSFAIFMALLCSPEVFLRAVGALSHPLLRNFLRVLHLLLRLSLLLSLFFGCTTFFIDIYQVLFSMVSPLLDRTVSFLAGPSDLALPILFIEKLVKVFGCSFLWSFVCLGIQKFRTEQEFPWALQICLSILGIYLLLNDFQMVRLLAHKITRVPSVKSLLYCQLGRFSLLIGCSFFLRNVAYLPGFSVAYVLLVYFLGVYSLAISATPNLFPIK